MRDDKSSQLLVFALEIGWFDSQNNNNNNPHQFDEYSEYDGHIDDDGSIGEGKNSGVVVSEEITEDQGCFVVWNGNFSLFLSLLFLCTFETFVKF